MGYRFGPGGLSLFFEAADGIRNWSVTGVQTCALRIFGVSHDTGDVGYADGAVTGMAEHPEAVIAAARSARMPSRNNGLILRSEERRVGKECRSRWSREHLKKNRNNQYAWRQSKQRKRK